MIRIIKLFERIICVGLVIAIVSLTLMQIVARYGMSQPFTWTEEISRFALISLTFIGTALITGTSGHIVVDLSGEEKGHLSRLVDTISRALVVLSGAFLSVLAGSKAISMSGVNASATGIPLAALYWIMSVGFGLMALHALLQFFIKSELPFEANRGV